MQSALIENLRWMRIVGDSMFLGGVGCLLWFMVGLKTGWSYSGEESVGELVASDPAAA